WQLGESRLIANANASLTMQHRRAYQEVNRVGVANGHLVKRWPNEELLEAGQTIDPAFIAALCREEGEKDEEGGSAESEESCYLKPH
ncbi:hypothetical protein ACVBEH_28775, partial [Roseateles sp. GG27B]